MEQYLKARDFNEIAAFVEVARRLSFSNAARQIGIPKSTLSRKVAELEHRLGATLLHRTTRKLKLTEVGEKYFQKCEKILTQIEDVESETFEDKTNLKGVVRITAPADMAVQLFAQLLAEFSRQHPLIELDLILTDRIVDLVEENVDFAIRSNVIGGTGLKFTKLGVGDFILVAAPKYLNKYGHPQHPDDLSQHRGISFAPQGRDREIVLENIKNKDKAQIYLATQIRTTSPTMAKALTIEGLGVACLPRFITQESILSSELAAVLPDWVTDMRPFYMVYPERRFQPARVRLLMEFFKTNLKHTYL